MSPTPPDHDLRHDPIARAYVAGRLAESGMLAPDDPDSDACLLEEAEAIVDAARHGIPIDVEGHGGRLIARSDPSRFRLSVDAALAVLEIMRQFETPPHDLPAPAPADEPAA